MTIQTTRKELVRNYGNGGLAVGYCDAYALLKYEGKRAFTAGVYGWNFDAYDVDGVLICTGYRGMIGKQPKFLAKYEKKARSIVDNWDLSFDKKQKRIAKLLRAWVRDEYKKN